jgi:hypothetical protein
MLAIAGGGRAVSPTSFASRLPSNYNLCSPLPARARRCGPGARGIRVGVPRQGQPGAFLPGQLRYGDHAPCRPLASPRPATPGVADHVCAKPIRARSVAGASGLAKVSVSRYLFLCLSGPGGLRRPLRFAPMPRITAGSCESFCLMRLCAAPRHHFCEEYLPHSRRSLASGSRPALEHSGAVT